MERKNPERITVSVIPHGSLMQINKSEDGKTELSGVEGRFLNEILDFLGFEYDFVIPKDREFGKLLPDGNWSGMVGMVHRGEADLSFTFLAITESRSRVVGFSAPYGFDDYTFISKIPGNRISLFTFLYPFDMFTWFSLFLTFCLMTVVLAICKRHTSYIRRYVYRLFGSSLGQSVRINDKKSWKFNLLVALWLLLFQVIAFSYAGGLLSFLIEPLKEDKIQNFHELSKAVQGGTHLVSVVDLAAQFLLTYNEKHLNELGKIVTSNSWILNTSHLTPETDIKPNLCLGINRMEGKLLFGTRDDVYFSEDRLYYVFLGFSYNRRFCCISKLNTLIYRASSAGLYNKILNDESLKLFLRFLKVSMISESVAPLSNVAILGPITLLGTGLSISFSVFIIEILYSKYTKRIY